jgi:hypothetical protein
VVESEAHFQRGEVVVVAAAVGIVGGRERRPIAKIAVAAADGVVADTVGHGCSTSMENKKREEWLGRQRRR